MKIRKVGGTGLHASELKAINKMEQLFQNSWHGFAGVVVSDNQGSMEIDCLLITHDRLLLVELKEWNGKIESDNGMWIQNGQNRGKSPFAIKKEHALRLQKLLQQELSHKLGYWLTVEAHVVLCGNATPDNLPKIERPFVHSLDEFLSIRIPEKYEALVANKKLAGFFIASEKPRPNSTESFSIIEPFFDGPKVKKKELIVGNFQANTKKPWFDHRNNVYKEYIAQDLSMPTTKGLVRRWDFNQLGTLHALQSTWSNIALRENRIGKYIRDNSSMRDYLLRYVNDISATDITEDFCELYELPRNTERLDEVIACESASWSREQRIDRVRALLAPFGDLHALKIAHRDVDSHNLWYSKNHQSILASGFGAAFFPETGTVSDHRKLLQSSPISLPEDEMCEGEIIDYFRVDVFLLASVAYQICFNQKLKQVNGVPEWLPPVNDPFDGLLTAWFEKSLSWDSSERFDGAHSMLTEFNSLTGNCPLEDKESQHIFEQLMHSPHRRLEITPYMLMQAFPPLAEKLQEAMAALSSSSSKKAFLAEKDAKVMLVKLWDNIQVLQDNPGSNRRVLQFLKRLEKFQNTSLLTPKLLDFGLMNPQGLFVVTEYLDGETWSSYLLDLNLSQEEKRDLAINLVTTVMDFHDKRFAHGDLHPENIILKDCNAEQIMLVDVLDYGSEIEAFNTDYGPSNPAITDAYGRDRFAVFKIIEELFIDDMPVKIQDELSQARDNQTQIPVALEPLLHALKNALVQNVTEEIDIESSSEEEPILLTWGANSFPVTPTLLNADDGGYYFNFKWVKGRSYAHCNGSENELMCFITGNNAYLQINLDVEARKIIKVRHTTPIPLSDVVSAQRRSMGRLQHPIALKNGSLDERCKIVDMILDMDSVIDALAEKFSTSNEVFDEPLTDKERQELSPEKLWKALAETEGQLRQSLQIESYTEEKSSKRGNSLYPYLCLDGRDLQIEPDDTYCVYQNNSDEKLGELVINETTSGFISIKPINHWANKQFTAGKVFQIESVRSKSSRDLRLKALERVMTQKSVLPNLASYFDIRQKPALREMSERPTTQLLRELYDVPGQEMNSKQLEAFQFLVGQGPVGVLQGPPGTGKTTFVSKFIHYLFKHTGANNILLVGQQHSAVDNVAIKAREVCAEKGLEIDTIRIGSELLIDDRMLPTHTRALQQKIRHKFHREYDMRISSLSTRLQLPHELVQNATRLYRSLAPLLAQLGQYERQENKLRLAGGEANSTHANELITLNEIRKKTLKTIEAIVYKQFDSMVGELPVDGELLLDKLLQLLAQSHGVNNPVKVGRLHRLLTLSQEWLDVLSSGEAGYERFMLKTKQLACGTLVGVGRRSLELDQTQFDWVIIDEAGRAQASELMVAMQSAKRVLLVGDHKQLPPFYQNGHIKHASKHLDVSQQAFKESDFERAFEACGGVTLDTQYRMIEPIGDLVSTCFYADDIGKLHTGRPPAKVWYDKLPAPWNKGVSWIDTTSKQGEKEATPGYTNQHEIDMLLKSLRVLVDADAVEKLQRTVTTEQPFPIGIITMYRAQKNEIETQLNQAEWMGPLRNLIRIDTVDSYQGQENKIIILSLVRDNQNTLQGFLRDAPRINVAISRAQERLVILGASRMWCKDKNDSALSRVFEYINERVVENNEHYQMVNTIEFKKEAIFA
ncbi:AAA domain-containing protein [Photobacterium angustum]|uniref:AAA domain-containing protein n=1 Tax=Photobacterium angustum TaxID=661 RepID=UPI0005E48BE4|nr:AAA domain-containing protein [Photobacterium angustum]KJG01663.1 nuclease [Photobacterium angustum]PSV66663.1 nuclease [Photobacterium angustum]